MGGSRIPGQNWVNDGTQSLSPQINSKSVGATGGSNGGTVLPLLMRGNLGEAVRKVQRLLNANSVPSPKLKCDGVFGPKTEAAVVKFQRKNPIKPDGIVGKKTWHYLLNKRVIAGRTGTTETGAAVVPSAPTKGSTTITPKAKSFVFGVTKLLLPGHLAPGKETIQINYEINDPDKKINDAKLEIFRKDDVKPIWNKTLPPGERLHGLHKMDWGGEISGHSDFPDSYVTVEFSPYKVKISVSGAGTASPSSQEATFEIVVVDLELELGEKGVLTEQSDKDIYDTIGSLPAGGVTKELRLISNLFKTSGAEMSSNSSASFDQYNAKWGEGPKVPIYAKVWIKSSSGGKVLAPKAWGKRRVLWDWEDVAEDASSLHPAAKTFVEKAIDYKKTSTKPNGDNCHKDRGGKRSDNGKPEVFTVPGPGFPFKVYSGGKRIWAAFSDPAKSGSQEGKTGVIFQPSRMSGDIYKLAAYFDPDPKKDLDSETEVVAKFKKEIGRFAIWREVHLVKYIKKKRGLAGFSPGKIQGYYDKAFIHIEDKTGGAAEEMTKTKYDSDFAAAINTMPDMVKKHAIDSGVSQYDIGDWAVTFRRFADFKARLIAEKRSELITGGATPATAQTAAQTAVNNMLTAATLNTAAQYANQCNNWGLTICESGCNGFMSSHDGVTIIQFAEVHSQTGSATSLINGYAPEFTTSGRSKCAFIQFAAAGRYSGNSNTMEQTISHEIGHHLFLPHAPLPPDDLPGGAEANAHDQNDGHCMMGYDYTAERKFCGFCLLRLRGWDHRKLDKDGTKNKM